VPVDDPTLGPTTQWVESEIDEEVLRQIARVADGLYFRAEDTPGLRRIYDQINELEKSDIEVQVFTRYRDLAVWFLLPALALTFLELVLRQTVFRSLP
jgi:Ca-activated chloride channel family protein